MENIRSSEHPAPGDGGEVVVVAVEVVFVVVVVVARLERFCSFQYDAIFFKYT